MTNKELKKIEDILQIVLPETYKSVMLKYPFVGKKSYTFAHDDLFNDVQRVIDTNLELRESGFELNQWPEYFFCIGEDRCGDYYFINVYDPVSVVYYADHETDFIINNVSDYILYKSIEEFIDECVQ